MLSLDDKLRRLVYLNSVQPRFVVGNPDEYQKDVSELRQATIEEAIQNDLKELFAVLDEANKDKYLPRRATIFLILAQLMHHTATTEEHKSKITAKVFELSESDEDFFDFIKYYTISKQNCKMPSSVQKLVKKFYNSKTPLELAMSVATHNRMHTWTHKDLIKLAHFKSETPLKNTVINYILTRTVSDKASEEELKVLDVLRKSDELRKGTEPVDVVAILGSTKLTMDQVSPDLHQNKEVWSAAIPNMSIQQLLPPLGKLYKLGLINESSAAIVNHLVDLFTTAENVKASGVHPMEVFTYMKKLEIGGKPMDLQLVHHLKEDKKLSEADLAKAQARKKAECHHMLTALSQCFELACSNLLNTRSGTTSFCRYFVSIDVTAAAKKAACIGNKVLTFLEAAIAYSVALLRTQDEVVIAVYHNERVAVVHTEKNVSFSDLLRKVTKAVDSKFCNLYSPLEYALEAKMPVDVFINFIYQEVADVAKEPKKADDPIISYREKLAKPNLRFITFRGATKFTPAGGDKTGILDILGFDVTACKVAESSCRLAFQ